MLAARAMAAVIECHEDMIAGADFRDRPPGAFNYSGTFVPQHDRLRHGEGLVAHPNVGVANPRGYEPHEDFVIPWLLERQGLKRHRSMRFARDGGLDFHRSLLLRVAKVQ